MNDKQEIYLRILSDVRFVSAIFDSLITEADSFSSQMLQERIIIERNALNVEQERIERETKNRQELNENKKLTSGDD